MMQALVLFAHLMVAWLLLSGHFDPTMIGYGVLSAIIVVALCARLQIIERDALPVYLGLRPFLYLPWLFKEIVLSNLSVAKVILDPRLPIRPRLLRIRASQKTEMGQVIYANSITLTPGTVTLDVRGGELLVHALTRDSADGLLSGEMDRRAARVEGTVVGTEESDE